MKIKNIELNIVQGDLTRLKVDAIVNPARCDLKMEAGLAGCIKQQGGASIEKEAHKKAPVQPGNAVWTLSGDLKTKYIIHAVTVRKNSQTDEHLIRQACARALECAAQLKIKSIALPALGCGMGGFPVIGSAKIMAQEILKFARFQKSTITKVVFCLFDQETFQVFDKTVGGYINHVQNDLGNGPYVTADIIIELKEGIILIERSNPPYGWALPGGFLDCGETLEEAAVREAKEETNMNLTNLRQFHTYSDPRRDPRFQTVTTVFIAKGKGTPRFGDDAQGLKVVPYEDLLKLDYAFDHKEVIRDYLRARKMKKN